MNKLKLCLLAGAALFGLIGAPLQTYAAERIRGVVTSFSGDELQVKTRDGKDLKFVVSGKSSVDAIAKLKMSDIKKGSFVGATAIRSGPDKQLKALEVHIFPEAARGTGEGHYEWDLAPGSTMTNANVEASVDTNDGKELTLSYKGGSQKIIVPPGVPIVTFVPGDKSLLKPGAQVFIIAQPAADGSSATALRIHVGKGGMPPPM